MSNWIKLFLLCSFVPILSANAQADKSEDFVSFFKQALSSPPDVDDFVATQRQLNSLNKNAKGNEVLYYKGARANSNFFLCIIVNTNDLNSLPSITKSGFVSGRNSLHSYAFSQNAISYGYGTNAMQETVNGQMMHVRQFLDMGLGEVAPETIVWSGDTFHGINNASISIYGDLLTSNNLPCKLTVRAVKDKSFISTYDYSYPDPPGLYGGFPSKIIISVKPDNDVLPILEIRFLNVHLAELALSDSFFDENKFKGQNILHTNIYTNNNVFVTTKTGKFVLVPESLINRGATAARAPNNYRRAFIYILFILISSAFSIIYIRSRKQIS